MVVFAHISWFVFIYLLFTRYWIIPATYLCWFFYDTFVFDPSSNGGRRSHFVRKMALFRYMKDYFPVKLIKTCELDPERNYLIAYHPHGVLPYGGFVNFSTDANNFSELFPGMTPYVAALKLLYRIPVFREYVLSFGSVDASEASIDYVLRSGKGKALVLFPGGAIEALDAASRATVTLTLSNRRGFIRKAIEAGSPVVPCFGFGENQIYKLIDTTPGSYWRNFQNQMQQWMQVSMPFIKGRGIFQYNIGILPHRKEIVTVVGKPIEVPHDPEPSKELVAKYHEIYCNELQKLFDEYKGKVNAVEQVLEIVAAREVKKKSI